MAKNYRMELGNTENCTSQLDVSDARIPIPSSDARGGAVLKHLFRCDIGQVS